MVKLPLTNMDSGRAFVTGDGKIKKNLFLLVYWRLHSAFNVKLNDKIALNQFANSLYQYAKLKQVTDKLNGDRLMIEVERWPNSFSYHKKKTAYLLLITTTQFYIEPKIENVMVSYKIERDGTIVKSGKVEIADPNRTIGVGMFQTVNAATDDYLTRYDAFYKGLGKQVIEKILAAP